MYCKCGKRVLYLWRYKSSDMNKNDHIPFGSRAFAVKAASGWSRVYMFQVLLREWLKHCASVLVMFFPRQFYLFPVVSFFPLLDASRGQEFFPGSSKCIPALFLPTARSGVPARGRWTRDDRRPL